MHLSTSSARFGRILAACLYGLALCFLTAPRTAAQTTANFAYTGAAQTFTVPVGVTKLSVVANGAQGGGSNGGKGGRVEADLTVTPGQVLTIVVGGLPFNGGGGFLGLSETGVGEGGGGTDIRIGGNGGLADRVLVAGGGGGGGGADNNGPIGGAGGLGGGLIGGKGGNAGGGFGGTQTAGGLDPLVGFGIGGTLGNGGRGSFSGGGGGGFYGGAGGITTVGTGNRTAGGGGGSSYTRPSLVPGLVVHTQGENTGNGSLSLTYTIILPIRYVKPTASGTGDGSSWTNASGNLQAMIDAPGVQQVWVAGGIYKPTSTDRAVSFQMKDNVAIYGGFAGTETSLANRPATNPLTGTPSSTTLSGDIGTVGTSTDNSYHVITNDGNNLTPTAVLDGFVITGGNASENTSSTANGGGMYNNGSSPTLTNCSFVNNSATLRAGGLYNILSGPTLTNCSFVGNTAANGGGMTNFNSIAILTSCSFVGNTAASQGAGIYNFQGSNNALTNCSFVSNTANFGGGIGSDNTSLRLTNCLLQGNLATRQGGGLLNGNGTSATLTNCSFQNNAASELGGGMYNSLSSPTLTNCVVFGNGGTNTFVSEEGSSITANYSLLEAGLPGYTDGINNLTTPVSPFVSTTNARLIACSPAINAGNNEANSTTTDLAGNPRLFNGGRIDMGTYEFQGTPTQPVTITQQPPSGSLVCQGSTVSIPLSVSGTGAFTYQLVDATGAPVGPSQSTTPLTLANVQPAQSGSYSIIVTGSCNSVTSTAFSLTVNAPPVATLTATPSATLSCAQTSLTLTAGGGDTYAFSGPGVLSQSSSQAVVNAPGTYSVTVTNASCTSTTTIAISQNNTAPVASLASSGTLSCAVTSVTLTASPNGLSYVFSAGANQIGTSNQALVSTSGTYSVTVLSGTGCSAVASTTVASTTAVVSVTNPTLTTATQGVAFSQAFTATGAVTGSPDRPYTYSLVSGNAPTGLNLYPTGVLSGTPTQTGNFTLTVGATDANGCSGVSAPYVLRVSEPVFVGTLRLAAPLYNCQTGAITFRSVGGDNSGVEYRAIGVTDWTTNPSQVVDLPVRQDANAQPLVLQARQGGVMVTYTFDFRVFCNSTVPNQPPVFTQPPTQTVTVGQAFAYRIPDNTFRDLNGTAVNFMVMNLPAGLSYSPDTRVISGVPTAVGSYSVTLSVSDPLSQSASGLLVIQVNPVAQPPVSTTVNQAPVFNGPLAAQSGTVGQSFTYTLPAGVFTDPNASDVLTYSAAGLPAGLQFVASSQRISGQPTTAGSYSVNLTATDPSGLSASGTLTITISTSATPPPTGAQPLAVIQPLYDCTTGAITFRTTGGDGSPIYFTSVGIVGYSTQTSYVLEAPIRNDANSQPLLIKATQNGVTTSYLFDFRLYCNGTVVTNPPVLAGPLPTQTGTVGVSLRYQLPPNSFTALNGGTLNYSVTGLPAGLSFTAGSNLISGVPTQAGSVTATITATDPLGQSGQGPLVFVIAPAATQPPVVQPLTLVAPLYDCGTGAFTFQTTGGDGTAIEYVAVGITGPTNVAGPYVVRPAGDAQPFTLRARQSGVEVSYSWDFQAVCSGSARLAAAEVAETWTLRSVGNPVMGELVVEVVGAVGQSLQLQLSDLNGRLVESRLITPTTAQHREMFEVSEQAGGVLLLQAQSSTRRQTLKVLKQ